MVSDGVFDRNQYNKYNAEGIRNIKNLRLKFASGFNLKNKSDNNIPINPISPPKPSFHKAIINPVSAEKKLIASAIFKKSQWIGSAS